MAERNCKQENKNLAAKILNLGGLVYQNRVKKHPGLTIRRLEGYDDYMNAGKDDVFFTIYKEKDNIGHYYVYITITKETEYRRLMIRQIVPNSPTIIEVFDYISMNSSPTGEKLKELLTRAYDVLKAIAREEGVQEAVNN